MKKASGNYAIAEPQATRAVHHDFPGLMGSLSYPTEEDRSWEFTHYLHQSGNDGQMLPLIDRNKGMTPLDFCPAGHMCNDMQQTPEAEDDLWQSCRTWKMTISWASRKWRALRVPAASARSSLATFSEHVTEWDRYRCRESVSAWVAFSCKKLKM